MTKKNRLDEIEDYCNYLEQLYQHFMSQLPNETQFNGLGFSQGGATAVRWLQRNKKNVSNLILWGAGFPMDLDYLSMVSYWSSINICGSR